jgi:pyruvate carboxylase
MLATVHRLFYSAQVRLSVLDIIISFVICHSDEKLPFSARYKADQAFELNSDKSPVAAYLDIDYIVKLCVTHGVDAVHP